MEFDGDSVLFDSSPLFFEKELSGDKSNTYRNLSIRDRQYLIKKAPQYIVIREEGTARAFRRKISDISEYRGITIFSWRPEETQ